MFKDNATGSRNLLSVVGKKISSTAIVNYSYSSPVNELVMGAVVQTRFGFHSKIIFGV